MSFFFFCSEYYVNVNGCVVVFVLFCYFFLFFFFFLNLLGRRTDVVDGNKTLSS